MGIPAIEVNAAHSGYNTNRRKAIQDTKDSLSQILEQADRCGVNVIMEPVSFHESNIFFLCDDLVELMEDLPHDRLVTMIDTATPFAHWEPFADYFDKLGDKIQYIHFVDANGVNEDHLRLGTGCLPMAEVLRVFKRYNYKGWFCIEILSGYTRDAEMYAGHDLKVMRNLLKEVEYE